MVITKLKAKNQLTIPKEIVNRLCLKPNGFFQVDIESNYIKLIPVDIEPCYTKEELEAMDKIVQKEKSVAKAIKPGREFSRYIRKITR